MATLSGLPIGSHGWASASASSLASSMVALHSQVMSFIRLGIPGYPWVSLGIPGYPWVSRLALVAREGQGRLPLFH